MSEVSGGTMPAGRVRGPPVLSVSFTQPASRQPHTCSLYAADNGDAGSAAGAVVPLDLGVVAATLTSQLYCLTVRSQAGEQALSIALSSTLGDAAAFQLSNENVRDGGMVDVSSVYQLLNEVDYVDRILLQPATPTLLILVFHPHLALQQHEQRLSRPGELSSGQVAHVKGDLVFDVSRQPANGAAACTAERGADSVRLSLPLQCVVGRSVLSVSAVERELLFDHCVPHTIYHRALTVKNEAPIATSFYLHMRHATIGGNRHESHAYAHSAHYHANHADHANHHSHAQHGGHQRRNQLSASQSNHPSSHHSPSSYHSPVFEVTESDTGKRLMLHSDPSPPAAVLDEPPAPSARELPCFELQAGAAVRLRISFRPPPLSVDVHRTFIGEKTHQLHVHNRLDSAGNNITVTMHTSVSADKRAAGFLMLPPSRHMHADRKAIMRALAAMLGIDRASSDAAIKLATASNDVPTRGFDEREAGDAAASDRQQEESELSELDFGDCYSGGQAVRIFSLSNTTSDTLEVTLGSAHAKGDVTFHLISESFDRSSGGSTRTSGSMATQHAGGSREDNGRLHRVAGAARDRAQEAAGKLTLLADEEFRSTTSLNPLLTHTAENGDEAPQHPSRQFTPSLSRIDSESNILAIDSPHSPTAQFGTRNLSTTQQPHARHTSGPSSTLTAAPPVLPSPQSIPHARSPSPHTPAGSPVPLSLAGRVTSELLIDMQQQGVLSPAVGTASPSSTSRTVSTITNRQSSSTSPSSSTSARLSSSFGSADGRSSRVGVIYLRPGTRRDLVVSYRPAEDAESLLRSEAAEAIDDGTGSVAHASSQLYALHQRRFRLTFNVEVCDAASVHMHPMPVSAPSTPLNSFTKRLRVTARVCTSFVSLQEPTLSFGDINLGTKRTESARLFNHSDLPALMEVSIVSQSIKVRQVQLLIPPRSPYSLKMDMVPRNINAEYHKHLSLTNKHNPHNSLTLRVTARIIDEHNVLFHDSLYSLTSPTFPELAITQLQAGGRSAQQLRDSGLDMPPVRRSHSFSVSNSRAGPTPAATSSSSSVSSATAASLSSSSSSSASSSSVAVGPRALSPLLSSAELPAPLHLLHFGRMVAQNPWARLLNVTNLSAAPLAMEWTASEPSEISILIEAPAEPHHQHLYNGERTHSASMPSLVEEDADDHEALQRAADELDISLLPVRPTRASALLPGSALHSIWTRFLEFCRADSQHNYGQLNDMAVPPSSASSASPSSLSSSLSPAAAATLSSLLTSSTMDPELERQYVKRELNRRRDLQRVMAEQLLIPLDKLHLAPFQTIRVYAVWTVGAVPRPWLSTRLRSLDAAIRITLLRYPRPPDTADAPPLDPTPVRFVPLQCMACQSQLDVAQRHIAFGVLTSMAAHERQLQLHNQSEAPLLFAIRTSGSIASGDLVFPSHSMGVVRPNGRLDIPFVFAPSLAGAFAEHVSIVNLQDHTQHNTVIIKALIKRPEHFWLRELAWNYGYVSLTCHQQAHPAQSPSQQQQQHTAADVEHGEDEDEQRDDGCDSQLLIAVVGESVSHWLVVKNISLKQRTFKAQLRSIRLSSSRSKQDVLAGLIAAQERLLSLSRQSSMELMHRSASVSSTFSPQSGDEEASPTPSPPFSGASSPVHALVSAASQSTSALSQIAPPSLSRPSSRVSGGTYPAPVATLPFFGSSSLLSSMSVPPSPVSGASAVTPTRNSSITPPPHSSAAAASVALALAGGAGGSMDTGHMSVSSSLSSLSSSLSYLPSAPAAPPLCRLPIRPCVAFSLDEMTAGGDAGSLQQQTANEEEEEAIQRKLRIAVRKHKHDKIANLRKRLGELQTMAQKQRDREDTGQRRRQAKDEQQQQQQQAGQGHDHQHAVTLTPTTIGVAVPTPTSSPNHSLNPTRTQTRSVSTNPATFTTDQPFAPSPRAAGEERRLVQSMQLAAEEGVAFTLDPNAVQSIRADLHVNADSGVDVSVAAPDVVETYEGLIDVYESKNKDAVRAVHFVVHVCSDLSTARTARQAHVVQQRARQQELNNNARAERSE